ncbi:uncharacterized protein LOC21411251 [Morus notabilis]|uniref:uncharacterized protein LOC21411251 n=1 Tax=Morus notabilis TaxID=981085 RepID=UPI000CED1888|nr:uncharacterized protein LOC21411251 [Morus notabilis]XP_024025855.1 uncharacterized protein LOC21411251 [Morus notabilis]
MKDEKFFIWYSGQEERQLRVSSIMMIISGGTASACPRRRIGTAGTRCPAARLHRCISGRGGTMEGTMGGVLEEGLDLAIEGMDIGGNSNPLGSNESDYDSDDNFFMQVVAAATMLCVGFVYREPSRRRHTSGWGGALRVHYYLERSPTVMYDSPYE